MQTQPLEYGPPTAVGGSASAKKVSVGGKLGIVKDPFGLNGEPKYLAATLPLDGYGIKNLGVSEDGRVLIGQLAGYYGTDDPLTQKPNQTHAWNVKALISAALASAGELKKHISLAQGAEQLVPTSNSYAPAGTFFDDEKVDIKIENQNFGDIIEVNFKALIAKALLAKLGNGYTQKQIEDNLESFSIDISDFNGLISGSGQMQLVMNPKNPTNSNEIISAGEGLFINQGVLYLAARITPEKLAKLRAGENLGNFDFQNLHVTAKLKNVMGQLPAGQTIKASTTVNVSDFKQTAGSVFIGDRPLDNPGYSEMKLSGSVGINQKNNILDVYRVEQRLKYLGYSVFGQQGGETQKIGNYNLGLLKEFTIDGGFGKEEESALRAFYAATHYLYNAGSNKNGIQTATSNEAKTVSKINTEGSNLSWLNAYNAPHLMNVYSSLRIPLAGSSKNYIDGTSGTEENYATSWLRDLLKAWEISKNSQGLTNGKLEINGLTDPTLSLFVTHSKGGHSIGMGLDLGFSKQFIKPTFQKSTTDNGQKIPSIEGSGWSLENANQWANLLVSSQDNNNQRDALKNFLSIYALTRYDDITGNGTWDDIPVVNGEKVRVALFGSGAIPNDNQIENNISFQQQLVQNVWIGNPKGKNPYPSINYVLGKLDFNKKGLHHGPTPPHENHFHLDIRPPKRIDIENQENNLIAETSLLNSFIRDLNTTNTDSKLDFLARNLLNDIQFDLNALEGEMIMFIPDLPSAYYSQSTPLMIAKADQEKSNDQKTNRSMGICHIANSLDYGMDNLENGIAPVAEVKEYFRLYENKEIQGEARLKILLQPVNGYLKQDSSNGFLYNPESKYEGKDKAIIQVEIGDYKVRIVYLFKVVYGSVNSEREGEICGKRGYRWRIVNPTELQNEDVNILADSKVLSWQKFFNTQTALTPTVTLNFAPLVGAITGQTTGNTITLDTNAAGYGWFVDSTPEDSSEFLPTSNPNEWKAKPGSAAEGKMDMLSVLLHEYGHVLGLEHTADTHDLMAETLQPGVRRLVSATDLAALQKLFDNTDPSNPINSQLAFTAPILAFLNRRKNQASSDSSNTDSDKSLETQYQLAANNTLLNGQFNDGSNWNNRGAVDIKGGKAELGESASQQSSLSQSFMINDKDRYLSFTLSGLALHTNANGPEDAFEVALLNAIDGTPLKAISSLNHSDALLNLQVDGATYSAEGLSVTQNSDGSRTYRLDLSGIPAGTAVTLFFDLLGFGEADSQVNICDVRLIAQPKLQNDSVTTAEDTAVQILALANDTKTDISGFALSIVQQASHGQVSINTDGSFVYTPNKDFNGSDCFTYKMSDGITDSNTATVAITVTPVNDAPTLQNAAFSTLEDTPLTFTLLPFANDVDSVALNAVIVQAPQHGTLSQNADGTYTYLAYKDWNGTDSFSYKVNDGELDSNVATVTLRVGAVNDAPVAQDAVFNTNEDTPLNFTLAASIQDQDSPTLSILLTSLPQHGILVQNANGTLTYTPNKDWNGTDSFTYKANDGELDSTVATVIIHVAPVNDAPILLDSAFTMNEDSLMSLNLLSYASDVEGDALTPHIVTRPQNGVLTQNTDGTFTYQPNENWNGTDNFTYQVNDGSLNSNVAIVTITVKPVNDAPVAQSSQLSTNEDTPLSFTLGTLISDVDSSTLSTLIVSNPTHGKLVQNANGTYTYTPDKDWNGIDSFTYKANDGALDSNVTTMTITVKPVNDVPIFTSTPPSLFRLQPSDDTVFKVSGTPGSKTTISFTLSRNAAYSDEVGFFKVDDATGRIGNLMPGDVGYAQAALAASRTITIFAGNEKSGTKTFVLDAGQFYASYLIQNDTLERWRSKNPISAAAANAPVAFFSTVKTNVDKIDHLRTTTLSDGTLKMAWEDLMGGGDQDFNDVLITAKGLQNTVNNRFSYQATASDVDGDTLNYTMLQSPAGAVLNMQTGLITWDNPTIGTYQFRLLLDDGKGGTIEQSFSLTVTGQPPIAKDTQLTTNEDTPLQLNLADYVSDADSASVLASVTSLPQHGRLVMLSSGVLTYIPDSNWSGTDSFTFKANDGQLNSNVATITIAVTPVNDAPVTANALFTTSEDTAIKINFAQLVKDVDSSNLKARILSNPKHGKLVSSTDGTISYIPEANWYGTDSFTYISNDGQLDSNVGTITIKVSSVNDAPTAESATLKVAKNGSITVDLYDLVDDVEDDNNLDITVSGASHGTIKENRNGTFTYTPTKNYTGNDSFTYTVTDGKTTTTATISIVVSANSSASITVNSVLPPVASTVNVIKTNTSFDVAATASQTGTTSSATPTPVIDWSGATQSVSTFNCSDYQDWMAPLFGLQNKEEAQDLAALTGIKIVLKP
ncbi:MAG: tandem-95 repeat protein [Pseudomonadota bacterium]